MFLSPEVTSNHDLRLCSLPGKSRQLRQTAWLFISIMLLLIWLQRYTVLKSISHVYHLHKKHRICMAFHVCFAGYVTSERGTGSTSI